MGTFELLKELPQDIKGLPQNVSHYPSPSPCIVLCITACRHITSPSLGACELRPAPSGCSAAHSEGMKHCAKLRRCCGLMQRTDSSRTPLRLSACDGNSRAAY